jgi:hypothetical protein
MARNLRIPYRCGSLQDGRGAPLDLESEAAARSLVCQVESDLYVIAAGEQPRGNRVRAEAGGGCGVDRPSGSAAEHLRVREQGRSSPHGRKTIVRQQSRQVVEYLAAVN